jgi:hypothetical protein
MNFTRKKLKDLEESNVKLVKENYEIKEELNKLKSQVFSLKKQSINNYVRDNNIIKNNCENTINNNITINVYGQEKKLDIKNKNLHKKLENKNLGEIICELIYQKHFKYPENMNIYMKTLDDCEVKRLSGWEKIKSNNFLENEFMKDMKILAEELYKYIDNDKSSIALKYLFANPYYLHTMNNNISQSKSFLYKNKNLVEEVKEKEDGGSL